MCSITYNDKPVGVVSVKECENRDAFWDSPIQNLKIDFDEFKDAETAPAVLNGFGVGDSTELMLERLYFMEITDSDKAEGKYYFETTRDGLEIQCYIYNGVLKSFTIHYK